MNSVRPYFPLIGFVLPTIVIGYGIVIPRSCIAGVNELSVGFGTTVLGAVLTYIAGQRAVMPRGVCTKPPLSVRLARAVNRQASSPIGLFGRLLGVIWRKQHVGVNAGALERLGVRPGHRVLEIGSGPGAALAEAARRARGGKVVGIDVSDVMVRLATRRNRCAVARGEAEVRLGDGAKLALDGERFDRIFSVHAIYFWRDLDGMLAQLAAALAPDGKLVLAFRPESDDIPARFRDPTYRFSSAADVARALKRVGLDRVTTDVDGRLPNVVFVTASRSEERAHPES